MEVEYPLFVANFENIPYNAQNNADPKPNIKPCKDQLRPEFSNIPLTSKHPNKASIKQKIFMDVIFSLNIICISLYFNNLYRIDAFYLQFFSLLDVVLTQ